MTNSFFWPKYTFNRLWHYMNLLLAYLLHYIHVHVYVETDKVGAKLGQNPETSR